MRRPSERIVEIKRNYLQGGLTSIPFRLNRLNNYIPGIIRGKLDCVTANSGVGKTTLTKKLYVFDPIRYCSQRNINYHVLYFALEESEEEFDWSMYSYMVNGFSQLDIRLDIMDFMHLYTPLDMNERELLSISNETIQKIRDLNIDSHFETWKQYVTVYDYVYTTKHIKEIIVDFALSRGKFYRGENALSRDQIVKMGFIPTHYVPDDPDEFVVVVTDHVSELDEDLEEKTLAGAIRRLIADAKHTYTKLLNYAFVAVHQQAAAQEDLAHVQAKYVLPTMHGLGDNKRVGRAYQRVIGLADPYRYGIKKFLDYENIEPMMDYSRFINFPKQRYGRTGIKMGLLFDGKTGYMEALPKPGDYNGFQRVYRLIEDWNRNRL